MLCSEVEAGQAFRYAKPSCAEVGIQFIKLNSVKFNVINVANWHPAYVHPNAEVVVLGELSMNQGNKVMCPELQTIYHFFKPLADTKVWSDNKAQVCVSWANSNGWMEWREEKGEIKFRFVPSE